MRGSSVPGEGGGSCDQHGGLRTAYDLADAALDRATADRPLDDDLAAADGMLTALAEVAPWPAAGR
ncbi:MAG TPA: hypothetical protein VFJ07_08320 [Streptosporangiaceae bacterium]|nr:hypothetical protein [Streptosporangiaceae bacterium]